MHGATEAAWSTVNVWVPMVSVPERAAPVFGATLKPTDPFPVPAAPEVMVSHTALLEAVHGQVAVVVTVTVPVPAAAGAF